MGKTPQKEQQSHAHTSLLKTILFQSDVPARSISDLVDVYSEALLLVTYRTINLGTGMCFQVNPVSIRRQVDKLQFPYRACAHKFKETI